MLKPNHNPGVVGSSPTAVILIINNLCTKQSLSKVSEKHTNGTEYTSRLELSISFMINRSPNYDGVMSFIEGR